MTPDDSTVVDVHALNLHPNACDVSAPITLAMDFTPSEPVAAGTWEVDAVNPADRTLTLGRTAEANYAAGERSTCTFSAPTLIDASVIPEHELINCGLLTATLRSADRDVYALSMVCRVTRGQGKDAPAFVRRVFNPLVEE
jgi:hypothetical protein